MPVFLLALCLSLCNSLSLSSSLFSYLTEGCRMLRSGWWSSNSIYSTAQRQTERAGESARERGSEKTEWDRERERDGDHRCSGTFPISSAETGFMESGPDAVTSGLILRATGWRCVRVCGHYQLKQYGLKCHQCVWRGENQDKTSSSPHYSPGCWLKHKWLTTSTRSFQMASAGEMPNAQFLHSQQPV